MYGAHAQPLFCSLNLFLIAVAVRVSLTSPLFINNCITTGVYLPKVYVEFFNRAPLKSRFCGPKALQKRTSNIFI